jgi:methylphosphotriester-DNA--protein-cysteine methyltransferase
MTIKSYARVRRIRTVLGLQMGRGALPWSQAAAEAGFADQAHLAREFAALTGLGPRSAAAHLANIRHRNVTP